MSLNNLVRDLCAIRTTKRSHVWETLIQGIPEQRRLGEACRNPVPRRELVLVVCRLLAIAPADVSITVLNLPAHPGTADHASDAEGVRRALAQGDVARHSIIFGH